MDAFAILSERGFVQQCTGAETLRSQLSAGPVTFYVGFDPTGDSLHAGHLVQVMAMGWLQRCGHRPVAVVGGGTARVGDPSGKTEARPLLDADAIARNSAALRTQLGRFLVLDDVHGLVEDNASWLLGLGYIDFLREIGRHFSVNKMLAMEAYRVRLEKGLSFLEFNYQLLQAYDYLVLYDRHQCRLQVGGDDQWGNILAGTDLIRRMRSADVNGLTTPLLVTASGAKMGKTATGALWLDPNRVSPFEWYQYWINVDDRDVGRLLRLYTFLPMDEVLRLESLHGAESREAKRVLAHHATVLAHGEVAALEAGVAAAAMVAGGATADMAEVTSPRSGSLADCLVEAGVAKSRSEGRRLIEGGGVRIDGVRVENPHTLLRDVVHSGGAAVVRVGKARIFRLALTDF